MNEHDPDVKAGKDKLKRICVHKGPNVPAHGSIMLVWRGCGGQDADITAMGVNGPKLWTDRDGGFFGRGHYTAYEAAYAADRNSGQPNGSGEKAMMLFAMAAANIRVITRSGDYTRRESFSDHYSRDPSTATAMLATVDTYFVPIKHADYQACPEREADAHEVIAGDDTQLLPLAVVYYSELPRR
jgi:hypothetical protein